MRERVFAAKVRITDFRIFMIIKLTADNVVRDSILLYFPKIQFSYKERKKDKT